MKTKVLLPMLAFICSVGMAFATVGTNYAAATGFIETEEGWKPVTVNCEEGSFDCRVYLESDTETPYTVYPVANSQSEPLESSSPLPIMISD